MIFISNLPGASFLRSARAVGAASRAPEEYLSKTTTAAAPLLLLMMILMMMTAATPKYLLFRRRWCVIWLHIFNFMSTNTDTPPGCIGAHGFLRHHTPGCAPATINEQGMIACTFHHLGYLACYFAVVLWYVYAVVRILFSYLFPGVVGLVGARITALV